MERAPSTCKLLLRRRRIPGAVKMATIWLIPKDAEKPVNRRYKKCQKVSSRKDSKNE